MGWRWRRELRAAQTPLGGLVAAGTALPVQIEGVELYRHAPVVAARMLTWFHHNRIAGLRQLLDHDGIMVAVRLDCVEHALTLASASTQHLQQWWRRPWRW